MFGPKTKAAAVAATMTLIGCGGDVEAPHDHDEQEVITTVSLAFTPSGGGAAIVAAFRDPDGDGGAAPTIDDLTLPIGSYDLAITFTNELEDPPEDITEEVLAEGDEHQVFFTGSAVGGILRHAYADMDDDGRPLGLSSTVTATSAGSGTLTVTLRHLPPIDDVAQKTDGLAAIAETSGIASLPGDTDASVSFDVQVQ